MAPSDRRLLGDDGLGPSDTSLPMTPETPVLPPRLRDRLNIRNRRPSSLITPCSAFLLILLFLRLLIGALTTPNILEGFLFAFIAIIPTIVVAWFILRQFQDEVVNRPFLLMQFLIAAIPLVLLVIPVETLFTVISALPVIREAARAMQGRENELLAAIEGGNREKIQEIFKDVAAAISLPALIVTLLLVAYLSAGLVEEVGKWLVSRRFLSLECICGKDEKRIGCRGILASACMAGLGFATTENIGYVMTMARVQTAGFPTLLVLLGLFRGVVALPVHVGTQLYIAIAAAQRYVFLDEASVVGALFQAVLFHGTFDALAFISSLLVGLGRVPGWIALLIPIVDIIMVSLLLLVCRARYKALLERERVAILSEPV